MVLECVGSASPLKYGPSHAQHTQKDLISHQPSSAHARIFGEHESARQNPQSARTWHSFTSHQPLHITLKLRSPTLARRVPLGYGSTSATQSGGSQRVHTRHNMPATTTSAFAKKKQRSVVPITHDDLLFALSSPATGPL